MSRLIIVSNRLPVNFVRRQGKLQIQQSAGGLVTGLSSFFESDRGLWIGWPGLASDRISDREKKSVFRQLINKNYYPVFISRKAIDSYYLGFCNNTIWPLFHYFTQYVTYNKNDWGLYKQVNEIFCKTILKVVSPKDMIWVHDYHLMLLPKLIRSKMPKITIGFFLHIPFPSFEVLHLLPWRENIIEGLLGSDLIGFHTYDYVRHFLNSIRRLKGYGNSLGQISIEDRIVKADIFPMGIDYDRFAKAVDDPSVKKEVKKIRNKIGERKIILSIDRLDYTKGILQRLEAFDYFLEKNKEYKEKVTLILVAVPSRTRVEHYRRLKKQIDELVGRINGKHGTLGWIPVWYLYHSVPFSNLVALYKVSDIALITPLRDGMNLIAKEFVATNTDGKAVLILSERTGASEELGEALIVNPNNKELIADSIREALNMTEESQIENMKRMQVRLQRYNIVRWANDFVETLSSFKQSQHEFSAKILTTETAKELIEAYRRSKKRLILLDYDGTLVPYSDKPEDVLPDKDLLAILKPLIKKPKNHTVIVSGRDKDTLSQWFGELKAGLIAEHGVWIKEKDKNWQTIEALRSDWKDEIRPMLELYMDRTPGSFIEEKDFSLVWHYRKVDPQLASVRATELKDFLLHMTANLDIGVLEGNKVLEVKNSGINKGTAVRHWLKKKGWDFIIAIGDDITDEDIFEVLPKKSYSIKVGLGLSKAKFNISANTEVRKLLKEFIKI